MIKELVARPEMSSFRAQFSESFTSRTFFTDLLCDLSVKKQSSIFQRTHEVMCEANGKWSSEFDYCNYKGRCEDLLSTKEIMFESCENNVKGTCTPKCKKKDYDVVIRVSSILIS